MGGVRRGSRDGGPRAQTVRAHTHTQTIGQWLVCEAMGPGQRRAEKVGAGGEGGGGTAHGMPFRQVSMSKNTCTTLGVSDSPPPAPLDPVGSNPRHHAAPCPIQRTAQM
jgi:hypothetical protein